MVRKSIRRNAEVSVFSSRRHEDTEKNCLNSSTDVGPNKRGLNPKAFHSMRTDRRTLQAGENWRIVLVFAGRG